MAHNPVNHPAQPIYRAISGLIGLYLVVFGLLGAIASGGDFFAQDDTIVLGQGTNLGFSVISALLGVIVLAATAVGRNIDVLVNTWLGYALMALGLIALALSRTDANFLNVTIVTCVVIMIAGQVLLLAGMYGRVGSDDEARAWQENRLRL
jgi:Domain of unknown function (DUF4383)